MAGVLLVIVALALALHRLRLRSVAAHNRQLQAGRQLALDPRPRLLEVFQNLIENACKFMGDQPAPRVWVGGERRDGELVCYVRDNGIGIAPPLQAKVFELFTRLDPSIEGTGVGLCLVKRIVEEHGGRIWVESAPPQRGSTFWFTLPSPGPG